jgi:endonuclease G
MLRTCLSALVGVGSGIAIERYRREGLLNVVFAAQPIPPIPSTNSSIIDTNTKAVIESNISPNSGRTQQIAKLGFPSFDTIRSYDNFILSYDRRNRTANWVLEHLTADNIVGQPIDRKNIEFFEDKSIHPYFRSTNEDYRGSGYDRGHLAAAGNHRSDQRLVAQTFILSNISPQVGKGFNRDVWNRLEKYCRWKARHSENVWVCTGPLYLPKREPNGKIYVSYEVIGQNHVSVPTHFFKVLVIESNGSFDLEAYVLPNRVIDDKTPIESFRVPVDTIERSAGLLFFERIPRNKFRSINGKKV